MTLVTTYASRLLAQSAVDAQPAAIWLRREREGVTYTIAAPGRAADRIRARGVRTEAPLVVLQQRTGTYCVPVPAVVVVTQVAGPIGTTTTRTVSDGTAVGAVDYDGTETAVSGGR